MFAELVAADIRPTADECRQRGLVRSDNVIYQWRREWLKATGTKLPRCKSHENQKPATEVSETEVSAAAAEVRANPRLPMAEAVRAEGRPFAKKDIRTDTQKAVDLYTAAKRRWKG